MKGKTIDRYSLHDAYLLIAFRDGTKSLFGVRRGWESGDETIEEVRESEVSDWDLKELGLLSEAEYVSRKEERDRNSKNEYEKREREHYEQLKRKFE